MALSIYPFGNFYQSLLIVSCEALFCFLFIEVRFWNEKHDGDGFNLLLHFSKKPWHTAYAASEAAEDEETVTLKWANANWSKAAKVKVFFLDADRKPVAEAVTALIKGKNQKN